jgi:hypothetical protein
MSGYGAISEVFVRFYQERESLPAYFDAMWQLCRLWDKADIRFSADALDKNRHDVSERLADVRCCLHNGINPNITPCPKSANGRLVHLYWP